MSKRDEKERGKSTRMGEKYLCLAHYSKGGKYPHCAICDHPILDELQLDHSNNDGKEQRLKLIMQGLNYQATAGWVYYAYLRKQGYPDDLGLQVLCKTHHDEKKGECYRKRSQFINITINIPPFDHNNPIPDVRPQMLWEEDEESLGA